MTGSTSDDLVADLVKPPDRFETLKAAITGQYDGLSRRLQQVAEYALAHPDDIALETIAVIANRARVPPSSLIRFAKALGFEGFSEMQRLFRARLVERAPSYSDRIRSLREQHPGNGAGLPLQALDDFALASIEALGRLRGEFPAEQLAAAVDLMAGADVIHVAAQRRAFPVATYLGYLLGQLDRRAYLLDSVGGMLGQQAAGIRGGDVLIAVSFRNYAPEVLDLVARCRQRDVPVIALTDGPLSPLVRLASVSFEVVEAEVQGFRSLGATMCLALALVVSLGHRLDSTATDTSEGTD